MSTVSKRPVPATYSGCAIIASRTTRNASASDVGNAFERGEARESERRVPQRRSVDRDPASVYAERPRCGIVVGDARAEREDAALRRIGRIEIGRGVATDRRAERQNARVLAGAVVEERREPAAGANEFVGSGFVVGRVDAALQSRFVEADLLQESTPPLRRGTARRNGRRPSRRFRAARARTVRARPASTAAAAMNGLAAERR